MNKLIYNFSEHGLDYSSTIYSDSGNSISFMIDKVELYCNSEGKVLSVTGFLPLLKAKKSKIHIPKFIQEEYRIQTKKRLNEYITGIGYDYFEDFPESEKYFVSDVFLNNTVYKRILTEVKYDIENKIILLGILEGKEKAIQINKNTIFGFDHNENLKYICIMVDQMIGI